MKILHILPGLSSGGIEQVVLELCGGFNRPDDDVTVISSGGRMVADIEAAGARHITLPVRKKTPRSIVGLLGIAALLRKEKFDIVHTHAIYPTWLTHLALKLVPKKCRPIFVRTFHSLYAPNCYTSIMTRGQVVIAVSHYGKQYMIESYPNVQPEQISVISNSIDPKEFCCDYHPSEEWKKQWLADFPKFVGKFVICLPGRVARYKGCIHLVEVVDRLKKKGIPAHGIFVGETKRRKLSYKKRVLARIAELGLGDSISWLGLRSDVRDIFVSVDAVLSLSIKQEVFGKTCMEALALGCPFAGYQHGGIGEQLEQVMPEGRCRNFDIDHMVEILEKWYHHPVKPSREIPTVYLRDTMIEAHRQLYQKVLDEQNAASDSSH
ncbi:MAG: glycosyltransferase [Akkermansia sp.]